MNEEKDHNSRSKEDKRIRNNYAYLLNKKLLQ